MTFSELIKIRREELGLTLEEVANVVGVKKSTILRWERGDINNPRRDRIALLASVLQLPPMQLIKEQCGLPEDFPVKMEAIEKFKKLSASQALQQKEEEKLLSFFRQLNDHGRNMLLTTAESFTSNPSLTV